MTSTRATDSRQQPEKPAQGEHSQGVDAAADATRRLIAATLHAGADAEVRWDEVAAKLNGLADYLDEHAASTEQRLDEMWLPPNLGKHDPVSGGRNPLAPPLRLVGKEDGSVEGVTTLGWPYQGPPGCVHGGVSALLLDHALGAANGKAGHAAMTAELTTRYHRPTPLFEPLTVTGQLLSVTGRKLHTVGVIWSGDVRCVSAEGLFIEVDEALAK